MNANLLKSIMTLRGVTQQNLADALHLSDASVRNKLTGRTEWTRTEIALCRDFLALTDSDMVDIFFAL